MAKGVRTKGIFRKITNKLNDLVGKVTGRPKAPSVPPKKQVPPQRVGYRGIAAGTVQGRPQEELAGLELFDEELPQSETERFILGNYKLPVNSSNVAWFEYFPETAQMHVGFLGGATYEYDNITQADAMKAVNSSSKGSFIWSVFRIRGTKRGSRKPYRRIA